MSRFKAPNVPYVEAFSRGKAQRPKLIVIAAVPATPTEGAALALAKTWHLRTSPHDPAHYVVDESAIYRCVSDKVIAGEAGPKGEVRINVCSESLYRNEDWLEPAHAAALHNAAELTAELCLAYNLSADYLVQYNYKRPWWKRSKGSIRVDILDGAFPYQEFIADVKNCVADLKR